MILLDPRLWIFAWLAWAGFFWLVVDEPEIVRVCLTLAGIALIFTLVFLAAARLTKERDPDA